MSLKELLRTDLTTAMKARDEVTVATIRLALGAITEASVAGKVAVELSDDQILKVLASEAKKRTEAAEANEQAGRPEQQQRELAERAVLERYLPTQLTEDEVGAIVDKVLAEGGFSEAKQLGQAMKAVQAEVAGRADGRLVAGLVKAKLS